MARAFRTCARALLAAGGLGLALLAPVAASANPWNGKVVFQAFWWDLENQNYPQDWYTYLAKLAPRLRDLGFDGMWIPSPAKGASGGFSMGYDLFDHYDLGDKDQRGTLATRFGTKDQLLRLIAVAHANGLEVYPDIVLNHMNGGDEDPQPRATGSSDSSIGASAVRRPAAGRRAATISTRTPGTSARPATSAASSSAARTSATSTPSTAGGAAGSTCAIRRARGWSG